MHNLMYRFAEVDNRVVVFDTSDSFNRDELVRSIPESCIDNHISFYDIGEVGIPVNIFNIESQTPAKRTKELCGILTAPFEELSDSQKSALKNVVSNFLDSQCNNKIDIGKIIEGFDDENKTHESLLNRLSPIVSEIDEYGVADIGWDELFESSGKVIVISMENCISENGNALLDMMMASMVNYHMRNREMPLMIMIDEIQNQNTNDNSPIARIMKEGRKYQLSLTAATQSYELKGTGVSSVMQNAGTEIFFKPTIGSMNAVANALGFKNGGRSKFNTMRKGECYIKGNLYNK